MQSAFVDKSDCRRQTIFPGVDITTAAGQQMMLSYVHIAPNAVVEQHSHPHEQVGIVVEGRAHFYIGDEDRILVQGDMYRIPGGVPHRVVGLEEGAVALDVFHPIREDYL